MVADKFPLTVIDNGYEVAPPGWMYTFAFAVNGCKQAILMVCTRSFEEKVRSWLKTQKNLDTEKCMDILRRDIERLMELDT